MQRFAGLGLRIWVTELDVAMAPGCTQQMQAAVYASVLKVPANKTYHRPSLSDDGGQHPFLKQERPMRFKSEERSELNSQLAHRLASRWGRDAIHSCCGALPTVIRGSTMSPRCKHASPQSPANWCARTAAAALYHLGACKLCDSAPSLVASAGRPRISSTKTLTRSRHTLHCSLCSNTTLRECGKLEAPPRSCSSLLRGRSANQNDVDP